MVLFHLDDHSRGNLKTGICDNWIMTLYLMTNGNLWTSDSDILVNFFMFNIFTTYKNLLKMTSHEKTCGQALDDKKLLVHFLYSTCMSRNKLTITFFKMSTIDITSSLH